MIINITFWQSLSAALIAAFVLGTLFWRLNSIEISLGMLQASVNRIEIKLEVLSETTDKRLTKLESK